MTNLKNISSVVLLCVLSSIALAANENIDMTPDLAPLCNNAQIWDAYDVTPERCLAAGKACVKEQQSSGEKQSVVQATQKLYACLFDKLNIKTPGG